MCGIVAWVGRTDEIALNESLRAIRHRGPDAMGTWGQKVGGYSIAFGHARLSIIDLSTAADQPFVVDGGVAAIVFNGEIYNHKALRQQLLAQGVQLTTQSDTEVLLRAYVQYGRACLSMLRGMFAFVILDQRNRRVVVARDGFGIKPLYFVENKERGEYAFASEVRALEVLLNRRFPVDNDVLAEFLLNGFLYEPRSGLAGVHKIPPGGGMEVDLESGRATDFSFVEEGAGKSKDVRSLVTDELALEVEADVPVGIFFSGGVDSTVVAAFSEKKVEALYVDYSDENEHADRAYAREIAAELKLSYREISHRVREQSVNDIVDDFRAVAAGTEEPISDYTFSATKLISRVARQAGYKVMLSGMGGDELFAGYPRHALARRWSTLRWLAPGASAVSALLRPRPGWARRADRLSHFLRADSFGRAYTSLIGYFSYAEVSRLLGDERGLLLFDEHMQDMLRPVAGESCLKRAMHMDRYGYLSHNLTVTDKASMSESIEVRVPLLTEDIARYGFALPDDRLMQGVEGKEPLKQLLRSRLPAQLVDRRKQAFNPPLDVRLRKLGRGLVGDLLLTSALRNVLDNSFISQLIDDHFESRADNTYRLWQLVYLALWVDLRRPMSELV